MRKLDRTFMKLLMLGAWLLAGCGDNDFPTEGTPTDTTDVPTRLEVVASGLTNPLHLTAPAGDARLFIVEQPGRIRIVQNGQLVATPFLDITSRVQYGGEQGLLSVAFHPQYSTNGFFFVNFTDRNGGTTRVERFRVSSNPNLADATSATLILQIAQPFANHNGGHILFGPDGMLFIAMGDGGSGGDPLNHGQDRATLLGDLLRINVDGAAPYTIPSNNPYVGHATFQDEIWGYGLRNPWRIAIDRVDNMLYVADVGQSRIEEINVVPLGSGGLNYGWRIMEGAECFNPSSCTSSGLVIPAVQYGHSGVSLPAPNDTHPTGCSITGGIVYRGQRFSAIRGHYFYSDWCGGWIRSFRYASGQVSNRRAWNFGNIGGTLSFGEDAMGEMYVLSDNGTVYLFSN